MFLLIDRDILGSFCSALDVECATIGRDSGLFFSRSGLLDFVYWEMAEGDIRLEMEELARTSYLQLIEEALEQRRPRLSAAKGRKRRVMIDEVAALVAMRRLLRGN